MLSGQLESITLLPRSVLTIKRDAINHNVREVARFSQKKIIAVIKSNAYGVGVKHVAMILRELEPIDAFAVATVGEGVELRETGFRRKILILGGVFPEEIEAIKEYSLTPVVSDPEHLKVIGKEGIRFHVKYDTGMGRLGFVNGLIQDPRVEGIMSHLSTPADREFSLEQIRKFESILKSYKNRDLMVHLESSAGLLYRVPFTTHVRVGLALYGEKPLKNYPLKLKQALGLRARLISVKDLPEGHPVSYGRTFITNKQTKVGVVAFGYADGLMKSLSGRGHLYWKSYKLPIIGNITMDMTMIDLGNTPAKTGDWIDIVGEAQSFGDLAKVAGTIPYELMCNISERVKREVI